MRKTALMLGCEVLVNCSDAIEIFIVQDGANRSEETCVPVVLPGEQKKIHLIKWSTSLDLFTCVNEAA
ncbi:hypothetical protein BDQ12DRAFT_694397 [Crucibulum laeve]|uniref:Uncharacterized protein n=1 Tax=Crucibulum laeve TaxID=68775 RepID=A0A5C3LDW7_9AGAR|nr:hypothetical protein BDQ12DRAFT_694397 [Crucibulum laeve]